MGSFRASIYEASRAAKDNFVFRARTQALSRPDTSDLSTGGHVGVSPSHLVDRLRVDGFALIPGFLTDEEVKALRQAMDSSSDDQDFARPAPGNDRRIYFADELFALAKEFKEDPPLRSLGESYLKTDLTSLFTLLARVSPTKDDLGSGGSWHQDSRAPQFKAMVYLSAVECAEDGAFQIVRGSNRFARKMINALRRTEPSGGDRWTVREVDLLKQRGDIATVLGNAGDCLIFDSSSLHRGHPVRTHPRYAMTNYYFPSNFDLVKVRRQFVRR
jgi:hypothetical protein